VKVFAIQTYEPSRFARTDDFFDLGEIGLFADHEKAETVAAEYNEMFNDETPAQVVELDVL
jgi:hypothetical protein